MLLRIGIAMLGILIAIPLLSMWRTRPANVWLGLFISSISLLTFADLYVHDPDMFGLFDWPLASFGAFYYFYVRGVIGLKSRAVHLLHGIPFLIFVGFLIWIRLNVPGWTRARAGPLQHAFIIVALLAQALCFGYTLLVFRLLQRHRRHVRAFFSSTAQRDLHWLTWLTTVLIVNFFLWALTVQNEHWALVLNLGQLAMLYFVGWYGTRQVAIFRGEEPLGARSDAVVPALAPVPVPVPVPVPAPAPVPVPDSVPVPAPVPVPDSVPVPSAPAPLVQAPEPDPAADKYARSGMTDAAKELIGKRLLSRMNESHDYLDNDITLATLAERIGTSPQLVSQYLNHELGVSFFDYINGFRIGAVEKRLQDPASKGMTLIELALACGFNSKSTFNAAFKRIHGVAPSVWRSEQARRPLPAA